jgi:branched-chain amino acid transport system substrate-binding protein
VRRWTPWSAASKTTVASALAAALAAATGLTVLAGLSACGGAAVVSGRTASVPIHIGAIYNVTGSHQSDIDIPALDGARLAVDRINAAGGILGRRVELLERDGQGSTSAARYDARDLAAQHVSAMIGLSDNEQVLAAAQVAAASAIPFVTSGATSPRLPAAVPNWLFLACFGNNAQAAAGAEYAVTELGTRRVAVLYDKDVEYTRQLAHYFAEGFKAYGGTVVFAHSFRSGQTDAEKLMSPASDGDADDKGPPVRIHLIYLAASASEAGPLIRRLRAAGFGQPIMGGDSLDDQNVIAAAESSGGGLYFTAHAALGLAHSTRHMRTFSARYTSAYGRTPENAYAALGYDTVDLVAKAIRRAGSADPAKIRNELLKLAAFNGVTGTLTYTGDTYVPLKQISIVSVGRAAELAAEVTPIYVPKP